MKNGMKWLFYLFGSKKALQAKQAWECVFDKNSLPAQYVLKDLAVYCNFHGSSYHENSHKTAFNEGARDVFLHILEMSNLDTAEVLTIISNKEI